MSTLLPRVRRRNSHSRSRRLFLEPLERRNLLAAIITVTTTADDLTPDDGSVSLREAITAANANTDLGDPDIAAQLAGQAPNILGAGDTIQFNIPGSGVHTISPTLALPQITDSVTIDGYTQPANGGVAASPNTLAVGNNAVLLIELNGTNSPASAFTVSSPNNTFKGLVINRFPGASFDAGYAFRLLSAGNTIQGCFLGTNPAGDTAAPNHAGGVSIEATSQPPNTPSGNNIIGGATAAARNVIVGGATGFAIDINGLNAAVFQGGIIGGDGNTVQGNYIGTNAAGSAMLGRSGIQILTKNNIIGGTTVEARNVMFSSGGFGLSLRESNASGNTIQGNFIGINATGTTTLGGNTDGINLLRAPNNTIGGTAAGAGNVISGNSFGISAADSDNLTIQGNLIGTNAAGTAAVPNAIGIKISGGINTVIGGTTSGARNIISANSNLGLAFDVFTASAGNLVQGNYIGTDITGTVALGNGGNGLQIINPTFGGPPTPPTSPNAVIIGGIIAAARNIISNSSANGILLGTQNLLVQGNYIGTDVNGTLDMGNGAIGVRIEGNNDTVGGTVPGAGNIVAFSGKNDLGNTITQSDSGLVSYGAGNAILGNSIFSNLRLGIDLPGGTETALGVTANDAGDADTGANNLQNYPVLTAVSTTATATTISGTLDSTVGATFRLEFFANAAADPSCFGEGQTFLGFKIVTDGGTGDNDGVANGNISFTATTAGDGLAIAPANQPFVTSTATNTATNDTSEFSMDFELPSLVVTTTADVVANDCRTSLREAINYANSHANTLNPLGVADAITFNIPGTGVQTIAPTSALPAITDPVTIDGYTQGSGTLTTADDAKPNTLAVGDNAVLLIELNGASVASSGLILAAGNSTVRGLVINRFGGAQITDSGISISSDNNIIAGNFLGTDATGNTDLGNAGPGVNVVSGAGNLIGGTTPAARNIISGNDSFGFGNVTVGSGTTAPPTGTLIRGNYIGTNAAGTAAVSPQALPNAPGVRVMAGTGTIIGGSDADDGTPDGNVGARNVISGNTEGVRIDPTGFFQGNVFVPGFVDGVTIAGNFIGVDATGIVALGNFLDGIFDNNAIQTDNLLIGGTAAGAGNVVSGNLGEGIQAGALHMTVQGNFIGTDLTGTRDLGNANAGVHVALGGNEGPNFQIQIGGTTVTARNIISGNTGDGVRVTGLMSGSAAVQGNFIGTQSDGQTALPNGGNGVEMNRPVAVGGIAAGSGNVIAHNGGIGVDVLAGPSPILGNSMFANGGLGIDLVGDGVTPNDVTTPPPQDADTGPNNLQNFPVISSASPSGSQLTVVYNVPSDPTKSGYPLRVEFFKADADGQEGKTFLGFDTFTTTDFAAGSKTFTFTPAASVTSSDKIVATATDLSTAATAGSIGIQGIVAAVLSNTSEFSAAASIVGAGVDLAISKTDGSATYTAGTQVTYVITVTNSGPSDVVGASVTDSIPAGLTGVTWTSSTTGTASVTSGATGSGNSLSATVNITAGAGNSVIFMVSGTALASLTGNLVNTAMVAAPAGTTDNNTGNNSSTDTDTPAPVADLATNKTDGSATYTPGAQVTYTITVTNSGPSNVVGASVADLIPAGLTGVTWTSSTTGTASVTSGATGSGNNLSATVNIAAGAGNSVIFMVSGTAQPSLTGNLVNMATVTAPTGTTDSTPGNNTATDTDTPAPIANLGINKTDGSATYTPGAPVTYTITVTNSGPSNVVGASVADLLPAGLTGVTWTSSTTGTASVTSGATGSGNNLSATVNIAAGAGNSAIFMVTGTVSATLTGNLVNTATVTAPTGTTDNVQGNNSSTDTDTPPPQNNVGVTKTDGVNGVVAGGTTTYTIMVSNSGTGTATNVAVSDPLPTGVTSFSWSGHGHTNVSGAVSDTIASLAPGGTVTYTVVATISASATGTLTNTVTVTAANDSNTGNNTASDIDNVIPQGEAGLPECDISTANEAGSPGTAVLQSDADNPTQIVLLVTGTSRNDVIIIEPRPADHTQVRVKNTGKLLGIFDNTSFQHIVVFGLAGNDTIVIDARITQPATLFGDDGNDSLYGGRGNDQLAGGNGNDQLFGGAGNDTLCGDAGNDNLFGGLGDDLLFGEIGNDHLYGEAGNDQLLGGDGNDFLYGGIGNDQLFGQVGNDQLFGDAGNDILVGAQGNDKLFGSAGRDLLIGGIGADQLYGEAHDDILVSDSTIHDENPDALAAILAEWTSTRFYNTRVDNIRFGGGDNGAFTLNSATVIDDGASDLLFGGGQQDWFLIGARDKIRDRAQNELVN